MVPRLSIIIPTLNEAAGLPSLLRRLRGCGGDCEVIVVDGGSVDGTVEAARPLADRVIPAPRGRAGQMNAGAVAARGEVLWFLHADTVPPLDAPRQIFDGLRRETRGWGRFDIRLSGRAWLLRVIERMMNWRSNLTGIATGDQAIFVRRDWFEAVGGFADIALMEDVDLSRRLRRKGRPLRLAGPAITSSRRWEQNGILRTVFLMWRLRLAYWLGADPVRLARVYRHG